MNHLVIPEHLPPAPAPTGDPLEDFLKRIANPNTQRNYELACTRYLNWLADQAISFSHARPYHVAAWRDLLKHYGKYGQPMHALTVNVHIAAVRKFYRYALQAGYLGNKADKDYRGNPAAEVDSISFTRDLGKTQPLAREQIRALLDAAMVPRDQALIATMFFTMCRVSAACGLDVEHYHPNLGSITLHEKRGKELIRPVHPKLRAVLEPYAAKIGAGPLFRAYGRRIERTTVWRIVRKAGKAAGIGPVHPHQLRASAITLFVKNGGKEKLGLAQWMAGHADASTTAMYDHSSVERVEQLFELFDV